MYTRTRKKTENGSRTSAADAMQQHKGMVLHDNRSLQQPLQRAAKKGTIEKTVEVRDGSGKTPVQLVQGTVIKGPKNIHHSPFMIRVSETQYYGVPHGVPVRVGDVVDFDPDPETSYLATNIRLAHPPEVVPSYRHQPLISNFFGVPPTNALFEETSFNYSFGTDQVKIEGEDNDYTASVKKLGQLGELELFDDEGLKWINQIHVIDRARRRGIAKMLLQAAINDHGTIYASTQTADMDHGSDSRHLTDEGMDLVNGCIRKGMNIQKRFPGMDSEEEQHDKDHH